MNYIKRLKAELAEKDAEVEALRGGMRNLLDYMSQEKFRSWDYVNTQDIVLRVQEIERASLDAGNVAFLQSAHGDAARCSGSCNTPLCERSRCHSEQCEEASAHRGWVCDQTHDGVTKLPRANSIAAALALVEVGS